MSPFNSPPSPPLDPISSSKQSDPRMAWTWTILGILSVLGGLTLFLSLAFYSTIQKMNVPVNRISSIVIIIFVALQFAIKSIPSFEVQWEKFKNFIKNANRLYYFMRGAGLTFLIIVCVSMGALLYGVLSN